MESKLIFSQFEPVKLSNEIVNFNQDPFKEIDIKPADPFDEEEDNIIYDGEDIIYNDNNILLNPFVTKKDSKSSSFKEVDVDPGLSFEELLKQEGVHFRITSGYRGKGSFRNGLTKQGRRSNHSRLDSKGNPMAYDVVPNGVSWAQFKKEIYGNPRIISYLKARGWGILDETRSDVKSRTGATGNHLHFGPDTWAKAMLDQYLNNKNLWYAQEGIKVPTSDFKVNEDNTIRTPRYFTKESIAELDNEIIQRNAELFRKLRNFRFKENKTDDLTKSPFYSGNNLPRTQQTSSAQQTSSTSFEKYTGNGAKALSDEITKLAKTNPDVENYRDLIMFTANRESGFNPKATTPYGTACGWFGMTEATRRTYAKGLTKQEFMNNPQAQVKAAYELMKYYLNGPTYETLKTVRGLNDKQIATLGWLGVKYYQDYAKYGHAAYNAKTMSINGNKNVQDFLNMYKS